MLEGVPKIFSKFGTSLDTNIHVVNDTGRRFSVDEDTVCIQVHRNGLLNSIAIHIHTYIHTFIYTYIAIIAIVGNSKTEEKKREMKLPSPKKSLAPSEFTTVSKVKSEFKA